MAWERLVDLYTPAVYCWCRKSGLGSADAADIGQEVFKSVAHSIARFRHDRPTDSFRGWLRAIARNKIRDFYRNRSVQASGGSAAQDALLQIPFDSDSETDESLNPVEDAAERKLIFRRAVELIKFEFEEKTWRAFLGLVVNERSVSEVAAELQMTPNAVYLAKSRVLRRLRAEFVGLLDA